MGKFLKHIFSDEGSSLRNKIIGIYALLIIYNVLVWIWAFYSLHDYPLLFSTAQLAFTLGLRHAVDPDHIAAIDNVTRKLMQDGKQPAAVGLYFSLGHSSVVFIATIFIAVATATFMKNHLNQWSEYGGIFTTSFSALFLLLIATINLITFFSTYKIFKQVRKGKHYKEEDINELMSNSGFLARRLRFLFKVITHSWQMYLLGFLFGIGFDTATEVALLGIAAAQTLKGLSIWSILIFPSLFTAGMTLIDTTDGILMLGTYGWAFTKPLRKLYYNLTITFISVIVALVVGSILAIGLISEKVKAKGLFWDAIRGLNMHYDSLGYIIILIFIVSWLGSIAIYKALQIDKLDQKIDHESF